MDYGILHGIQWFSRELENTRCSSLKSLGIPSHLLGWNFSEEKIALFVDGGRSSLVLEDTSFRRRSSRLCEISIILFG